MQSISLSQLRRPKQLALWLKAGEIVELRNRNRVIAHLIPQQLIERQAAREIPHPSSAPTLEAPEDGQG